MSTLRGTASVHRGRAAAARFPGRSGFTASAEVMWLLPDRSVLRTAAQHHGGCLGVYASVRAPGRVRVGDRVILS